MTDQDPLPPEVREAVPALIRAMLHSKATGEVLTLREVEEAVAEILRAREENL